MEHLDQYQAHYFISLIKTLIKMFAEFMCIYSF